MWLVKFAATNAVSIQHWGRRDTVWRSKRRQQYNRPMPTFTLTDAELRELRDRLEVWETGFSAGLERHDSSSDQRRDDERWADALKNIRARLARADKLGTFDPELTMRVLQKIENGSTTFNGNEEPELWDYAQRLGPVFFSGLESAISCI